MQAATNNADQERRLCYFGGGLISAEKGCPMTGDIDWLDVLGSRDQSSKYEKWDQSDVDDRSKNHIASRR